MLIERVRFSLARHPRADQLSVACLRGRDVQCVVSSSDWGPPEADGLHEGLYVGLDALVDVTRPHFSSFVGRADRVCADGSPGMRVKTVSLRRVVSQGLLLPISPVMRATLDAGLPEAEMLAALGVERYRPPVLPHLTGDLIRAPSWCFPEHSGLLSAARHPGAIADGSRVRVTEAVCGTALRVGLVYESGVQTVPRYFVGSHRTVRNPDGGNLYSASARAFAPEEPLRAFADALGVVFFDHLVVYGQVFGADVRGVAYGCRPGEQRIALFDVLADGVYQPWEAVEDAAAALGVGTVPLLYRGPFRAEGVADLRDGPSALCASQLRRGCVAVVEPEAVWETEPAPRRLAVKFTSDQYLLQSGEREST